MPEKEQHIWRTVSVPNHNGVFLWEVMEYMGDEPAYLESFVQCRDGSWVIAFCYHYWTNEQAEKALNNQEMEPFGAVYHTI